MIGMTSVRKVKVSVTIDSHILKAVDRRAAELGATRSAVFEKWLTQASRQAAVARLEEETAAYYDQLSASEREDDATWAAGSLASARSLSIDDDGPAARRPASRPPRRRRD
jgi:hypothetical protein